MTDTASGKVPVTFAKGVFDDVAKDEGSYCLLIGLFVGLSLSKISVQSVRVEKPPFRVRHRISDLVRQLPEVPLEGAAGDHHSGVLVATIEEMIRHLKK